MTIQDSEAVSSDSGARKPASKDEQHLGELIEKLKQAAEGDLKCVVLYGSAVTGESNCTA